jgi:hypothetical protein
MKAYEFTDYFENEVIRKRPYIKKEWCIQVLENPIKSEKQEDNRYRFWAPLDELDGRYLRVVTLKIKLRYTMHFLIGALNNENRILFKYRFNVY